MGRNESSPSVLSDIAAVVDLLSGLRASRGGGRLTVAVVADDFRRQVAKVLRLIGNRLRRRRSLPDDSETSSSSHVQLRRIVLVDVLHAVRSDAQRRLEFLGGGARRSRTSIGSGFELHDNPAGGFRGGRGAGDGNTLKGGVPIGRVDGVVLFDEFRVLMMGMVGVVGMLMMLMMGVGDDHGFKVLLLLLLTFVMYSSNMGLVFSGGHDERLLGGRVGSLHFRLRGFTNGGGFRLRRRPFRRRNYWRRPAHRHRWSDRLRLQRLLDFDEFCALNEHFCCDI